MAEVVNFSGCNQTVQRVVYSLDIVRDVLSDIDKNNIVRTKEMAFQSL